MRTLAIALCLAAGASAQNSKDAILREFAYTPSKFEATVEAREERDGWAHSKVTFPSAVETKTPENNTVHAHLVMPKKSGTGAAVIILPIWKGRGLDLEMIVAQRLAKEGIAAFVMVLPYQFDRAPDGRKSGDLTVSADLERNHEAVVQAVKDVKRSAQWLVESRGIDKDRLGLMGISLGGHIAALIWAMDPEFRAGLTALAGGNVHELLWNESDETRDIKKELVAGGMTLEKLAEMTKPYDPATWATPARRDGLMMIAALDDPVVPIHNVRALRDAFGKPPLVIYPGTHYSVALNIVAILDDIAGHFVKELAK